VVEEFRRYDARLVIVKAGVLKMGRPPEASRRAKKKTHN
jgi:hypothetical protein